MNKNSFLRIFSAIILLQNLSETVIQAHETNFSENLYAAGLIAIGSMCTITGLSFCACMIKKIKQSPFVKQAGGVEDINLNNTKNSNFTCLISYTQFIAMLGAGFTILGIPTLVAGSFYLNSLQS